MLYWCRLFTFKSIFSNQTWHHFRCNGKNIQNHRLTWTNSQKRNANFIERMNNSISMKSTASVYEYFLCMLKWFISVFCCRFYNWFWMKTQAPEQILARERVCHMFSPISQCNANAMMRLFSWDMWQIANKNFQQQQKKCAKTFKCP